MKEATASFYDTSFPFLEVLGILAGLIVFGFWLWVFVDCLKNERLGSRKQILWGLAIVFTLVIGAAFYALWRRPERLRKKHHRFWV